jgi:hypothetical protein
MTGLIAMSITTTGPSVPGGSTTFTSASLAARVFRTDGANRIVDIDVFSSVNADRGEREGVDPFAIAPAFAATRRRAR